ncbi:hypothetical protein Q1695_016153 [Nippostrongylus brasiliensis]|nr:hypothetical protein Q1695_016153 [Nippostrongylus brasiliensis]
MCVVPWQGRRGNNSLFGSKFPHGVRDSKDAKKLAEELDGSERRLIFDAIRKKMADQYMEHKRLGNAEIHTDDLLMIWYVSFAPAFAYGFIDSALLILAGQSIDSTIATYYGMTVMGAAALANVLTNVILFQSQVQFESLIAKLGLKYPVLSTEQMFSKVVARVTIWAKALGILLGSVCGLFPLLFYDNPSREEVERMYKVMVYLKENHFHAAHDEEHQAAVNQAIATGDKLLKISESEKKQKDVVQSGVFDDEIAEDSK